MQHLHIGLDLGGTKIEAVLVKSGFEKAPSPEPFILEKINVPTEAAKGYDHILRTTAQIIQKLKQSAKDASLTIGIGLPGNISRTKGVVKNSNTTCLNGKPLWSHLAGAAGQKIQFENDANCLTLSEATWGAGRGYKFVFGIILGTGTGGGFSIDGRIHRGRQNIAGEWGHSILHTNGNQCYCGKRGCVETYLSGPAFEKHLKDQGFFSESQTLKDIHPFLDSESFKAHSRWYSENFGHAVSNVINTIDPDVIVIGGGVSNLPFLYTEGVAGIRKKIFNDELLTPVLKASLGPTSGVFGAALAGIQVTE